MQDVAEEQFEDFADFVQWYQDLIPEEPINLTEAATIYFNLELYNF
jgi:hypothetical protein